MLRAMFALGSALREARLQFGLELEQVEEQTRISRHYLQALEEERFELLPGQAYAKAFLRSYADYLGLDAKAFADEYQTRLSNQAHEPALIPKPLPRRRHRLVVAKRKWPPLIAAALATLEGVLAWQYGGSGSSPKTISPPHPRSAPAPAAPTTPPPTPPTPTVPPPIPLLTLTAAGGACWIDVHQWSETGKVVYINTLPQGQTVRFSLRRPLWIRLGAPAQLRVTIAGKTLTHLPTPPANYLATRTGLRPA